MPRLPKGKKGIYIYLDEGVYEKLMELVKRKYNGLRGALSAEVQDALVHWIEEHAQEAHKLGRANPGLPRAQLMAREIIRYLKSKGFISQCSINDLTRAIEATRGSDPRTIRKWIRFLIRHKYIRPVNHRIFEIP